MTQGAIWKALNPEKARESARRSNAKRREAKRQWDRKRWALHKQRYQDRDLEIPGLLPPWNAHSQITDFVRVDIADWVELKDYRFSTVGTGYACTRIDGKRVYLHHLLVGRLARGGGMQTDHINRDKLDNRRQNVRVVTTKENQHNRGGVYERCWWRQQQAA